MSEEQLKSYYRRLLMKYHPDTSGSSDDSVIKQLIEEYHKLTKSKHSTEETKPNPRRLESVKTPESIDDVKSFIMECLKYISQNNVAAVSTRAVEVNSMFVQEHEPTDNVSAVLTVIGYMREFWSECTSKYDPDFDDICRKFESYAKNIAESANYLELLAAVNEPKQRLTQDILRAIGRVTDIARRRMLNAVLILILSLEM